MPNFNSNHSNLMYYNNITLLIIYAIETLINKKIFFFGITFYKKWFLEVFYFGDTKVQKELHCLNVHCKCNHFFFQ